MRWACNRRRLSCIGSYESPATRLSISAPRGISRTILTGSRGVVTLPFVHANTPLFQQGIARAGPTGREDLLMIAVSRLFLDNFDNIQVAWGKVGLKMTQLALLSGANDLAGTMFTDDVSGDAGAADRIISTQRIWNGSSPISGGHSGSGVRCTN